ncbi:unnamed protein product [Dicrocoelium dendriticum]|nr:unnamed protein product [Dicrocoelium dendriticum]
MTAKQYTRAFKTYKIGINLLRGSASVSKPLYPLSETDSPPKAPFSPEACNLLVLCEANAALCLLRLALLPHDSNGELKRNPKDTQKLLRLCTKHCHRAIELDPGYAKAWFRLAKALAELGDYDEAVEAGQKCLGSLKNAGVSTSGTLVSEVNSFLARWRVEAEKSNSAERSAVRSAVLRRYNGDYYAWSDDEDEVEKLPISVWSNSLAENMMSLHEELEAFGEKMPEPKSSRSRTSRRLEPVPDEYSDEEKFE